MIMPKVLGYVKPEESFKTLAEWDQFVHAMLGYQELGLDTRDGEVSCKHPDSCDVPGYESFVDLIHGYFGFLLETEVERYDLLTKKNVLDFIEDFINHRYWNFEQQYSHFFPDIHQLRFAFFYSRGDIEPYVLLDDRFTEQLYGSLYNPKTLCHYTTESGVVRLVESIKTGNEFDISCFTVMERPFFRKESNILVTLTGNVRAGFRSDVKSVVATNGRRACNMYRLEYPGRDLNNICFDLTECDGDVRTSIWNEYIATPIEILSADYRN
jgi:hypothetical protein